MEKTADKIVRALRRLSVETGSLACLGCGHEHNCSTHGCAILRDAADMITRLNDFDQSQSKIAPDRRQRAEVQLAAEKAKYAELQQYNVDCTKQCDALLAEKIDLKNQLAASKRREQAAVADIEKMMRICEKGSCHFCANGDCAESPYCSPKWRGPQEARKER
ncbi:MAG TPA: hypothetical protein PKN39_02355 [Oscillospiraceae bacterium]|nr:hypothetical protein [Oscillospiraceae bacterium]